jgi:hypothetical protein
MKEQGTGNREQGTGTQGQRARGTKGQSDAVERLLRQAVAPVDEAAEAGRDLWPMMQARLRQPDAVVRFRSVPWFDWALAGGVALFAVAVPAAIPVMLYYL